MKKNQSFDKPRIRRIGIDARFFGPKDKGFGRYTQQLVESLERLDKRNNYFVFLKRERWNDYKPANSNFKKVLADYKWYGIKEQIFLPLKLKKHKLDLVHFTHFNVPIFYWEKFVVTIHDLTLRHFPTCRKNLKNLIFYPFKNLAYRIVFRHAIKNSENIIAISEHTKKDILKYYQVLENKIQVIYEGVTGISPARSAKRSFGGRGKKPYLLYVGNDYPHKNLKRLKLAFKKLVENGLDFELVLITEFVSEKELDILYKNASLFVFPSLSEGFGLPPLEAMARGLPVVSSNATCLPEILGNAAAYFNPLNIDDMAEKIQKTLSDDRAKKAFIKKGFEQIKRYDWGRMAKETLDLYKKII